MVDFSDELEALLSSYIVLIDELEVLISLYKGFWTVWYYCLKNNARNDHCPRKRITSKVLMYFWSMSNDKSLKSFYLPTWNVLLWWVFLVIELNSVIIMSECVSF